VVWLGWRIGSLVLLAPAAYFNSKAIHDVATYTGPELLKLLKLSRKTTRLVTEREVIEKTEVELPIYFLFFSFPYFSLMWGPGSSSLLKGPWGVHKFGGTSVANATCYRQVATVLASEAAATKIPSAKQGAVRPPDSPFI